jgi:hypothetical protein
VSPAKFRFTWGFQGRQRISPQTQRQSIAEALGNQANFVINFCQILFDAKTTQIAKGDDHESV